MLKIRLQRTGKRNQPFFRIIVTDKDNPPRGGRALELLGFLNPKTKEKQLKADRLKHWLGVGAQPSDRVHNLLVAEGIVKAEKRPVHAKPDKKEGEAAKPQAKAPGTAEKGQPVPAAEPAPAGSAKEGEAPEKKAESKPARPAGGEEKPTEAKPAEDKKEEEKKQE